MAKTLLNLIRKKHSLIGDFVIFGSPARKDNGRIVTPNGVILGKQAQFYVNIFQKQIKRIKSTTPNTNFYPISDRDLLWTFSIYYNHVKADCSIELIFDQMESAEIVVDDVIIRNYIVLGEELDYELPRIEVGIYELKED